MSRTKNRGFQQSFSPSYTIRRWRLGEYIRLSKEDLKKGKNKCIIIATHSDMVCSYADIVMKMCDGKLLMEEK